MKSNHNIWTLSALYLAGEMNEEQEKDFYRWIENDMSRTKEFEMMEKTWRNFETDPATKHYDSGKAWKSLKERFEQDGLLGDQKQSGRRIPAYLVRVAAGILLLLCIGIPALYLG